MPAIGQQETFGTADVHGLSRLLRELETADMEAWIIQRQAFWVVQFILLNCSHGRKWLYGGGFQIDQRACYCQERACVAELQASFPLV